MSGVGVFFVFDFLAPPDAGDASVTHAWVRFSYLSNNLYQNVFTHQTRTCVCPWVHACLSASDR